MSSVGQEGCKSVSGREPSINKGPEGSTSVFVRNGKCLGFLKYLVDPGTRDGAKEAVGAQNSESTIY